MARLSSKMTTTIIGDSPRSEAINHMALVELLVEKGIISEKEIANARLRAKRLVDKELKTRAIALRKYYEKRLAELESRQQFAFRYLEPPESRT